MKKMNYCNIYKKNNFYKLKMKKVDYLCIGAAKTGTMSFINYMNLHPEIYCEDKYNEIHFFDEEEPTQKNIENYHKKFKTEKKIIGEKSPSYHYLFYALDRIKIYKPDIKLILILREPIQRCFSHFQMIRGRGQTTNSFETEMRNSFADDIFSLKIRRDNDYFVRSIYDIQIEYLYKTFDKNNVYIAISEEILQDRNKEYNKIYKFLGAKEINITKNLDTHINNYTEEIDPKFLKELYCKFRPHNENLYKILGRKISIWEKYYEKIKHK